MTVTATRQPAQPPSTAAAGAEERLVFGAGAVTPALVEDADPLVLVAAVAALTPQAVERLDEVEAQAYVLACERVTAAIHARQSLGMDTLAVRVQERLERSGRDRPQPAAAPGPDLHTTVAAMLAPALHRSTRAVRARLEADRWLLSTAEYSFAAHWQGQLDRARADTLADTARDLPAELRAAFETLVLESTLDQVTGELTLISPTVRRLSRAELARRAGAIARDLDPDSHATAAARAHHERRVVVTPDRRRPGLTRWDVLLPTSVSAEVFAAVEALADQYARAHPHTPIASHRADALADLVLGNAQVNATLELLVPVLPTTTIPTGPATCSRTGDTAADGTPATDRPDGHGTDRPDGHGTGRDDSGSAAASDGSGREDTCGRDDSARDHSGSVAGSDAAPEETTAAWAQLHPVTATLTGPPGTRPPGLVPWLLPGPVEVPRHGQLLPHAIAELLSRPDTVIRLARLEPDGSLAQDPHAYRPGRPLRRRVHSRDGTCRFPGCAVPATGCDLDHVTPHPTGPTTAANLVSLCRTHHRFKHHGGWTLALHPDASATWTAPDGRAHTTTPRPHQLLAELHLTDTLDPQTGHDLRHGWFPGLPTGMSLAALARAEAALPPEPPDPAQPPPAPPTDWQDLDRLGPHARDDDPPPPTWDATIGDDLADLTPVERHLVTLLALAA